MKFEITTLLSTMTTALLLGSAHAAPADNSAAVVRSAPTVDAGAPAIDAAAAAAADIPWDKVLRVLTSMVACQALIPVYEVRYFPAIIVCLPYKTGAVMVIYEL